MRVSRAWAYALALMLLAAGCALTTFTRGYRDNLGMQDAEVKQVQFFTSDEIVLQRLSAEQERSYVGSASNITSKTKLEEVVIRKGTPGVVLEIVRVPNENAAPNASPDEAFEEYFLVSFVPNDRTKALWFSTHGAKQRGRYDLIHVTKMQGDPPRPVFSPGFAVSYGGKDYHVEDPDMWQVHLVIDEDFMTDEEIDRVSPPGWRLRDPGASAGSVKVRASTQEELPKPDDPSQSEPQSEPQSQPKTDTQAQPTP